MALNINNIQANGLRAIGNRVLVTDMHFGEQKTASGLIIGNDDGKTRGIYPRWAKVYDKGPDNKDDYEIGQWILIEHGRWTRSIKLDINGEEIELRMVESESVLAYADEKPNDTHIGAEYGDAQAPDTHRPEDFIRPQF
jgi:co-chaperonin GroES (HSP10)